MADVLERRRGHERCGRVGGVGLGLVSLVRCGSLIGRKENAELLSTRLLQAAILLDGQGRIHTLACPPTDEGEA